MSTIEVGLGSILHALHVPLAGHFLSLNQGFLLTRATKRAGATRTDPATISNVSAVLKSLSPAGKRLLPMLAISAQGLLMTLGTLVFGTNLLGHLVGMALLCLWAFFQPIALAYLIYGNQLVRMASFYLDWARPAFNYLGLHDSGLIWTAVGLIVLKVVMGLGAVLAAYLLPDTVLRRFEDRLLRVGEKAIAERPPIVSQGATPGQAARFAMKDILNKWFLIAWLFTGFFLAFSGADRSDLIIGLLRPLALGFLVFFVIRILPLEHWLKADAENPNKRRHGFWRLVRLALVRLREL